MAGTGRSDRTMYRSRSVNHSIDFVTETKVLEAPRWPPSDLTEHLDGMACGEDCEGSSSLKLQSHSHIPR